MAKKRKVAKKKKAIKKKSKKAVKKKKPAKKRRARKKGLWTASEAALLRKLFANNPTAQIAAELGRPTDAVKKKAARMGLRKSKRYMKTLGR